MFYIQKIKAKNLTTYRQISDIFTVMVLSGLESSVSEPETRLRPRLVSTLPSGQPNVDSHV